ncbi:helix-turn-helix transcriptional regulator [Rahnella laticis]|uniref:helix-turn-helix transcriptional regulator n=1 Tax=Rahnella laticis TaxID=2787622 RepID=UPI0018A2ACC3|nr:LuxR C-terminal-related transcriptional regulator [Rahnella laticis]MBF7997771.1 helix-turn-helix transcriptional regulator [Rahnella laticis]
MKHHRKRGNAGSSLLLPDDWSGGHLDSRSEPIPSWFHERWSGLKTVTIICTNNLAIEGLRHVLAGHARVRVRVFSKLPAPGVWERSDTIIWMREKFDSLPELIGVVLRIRLTYPTVRQLVISDFLPLGLTRLHRSPLNGVILAWGKDDVSVLHEKIVQLMSGGVPRGLLFDGALSPSQWSVLFQIATGANTQEISAMNGIAIKTVITHRMQAMGRLGLRSRIELAYILRCVRQMQTLMPIISRTVSRGLKKKVS